MLRVLYPFGFAALLCLWAVPLVAAEPSAQAIEFCGLNCGLLSLVRGKTTQYQLGFTVRAGAGAITLGDPRVADVTLIKSEAQKDVIAIKALQNGDSSITLRDADGEVAAHFDLEVGETKRRGGPPLSFPAGISHAMRVALSRARGAGPRSGASARSEARSAMESRNLPPCDDEYCGTLVFKSGREIVFLLDFAPDLKPGGVRFLNPALMTSTLIRIQAPPGGAGKDRYQLSLRAIGAGESDITIRNQAGKVAAHYKIEIEPSEFQSGAPPIRHDDLLFRGAVPKDETVIFILSSDDVSAAGLEWAHDQGIVDLEGRDTTTLPEPVPADFRNRFIVDLMRADLAAAAAEFDRKGARTGLIITGPAKTLCQSVDIPVIPAIAQSPQIRTSMQAVSPHGSAAFYLSFLKALELLKVERTATKRIVLYSRCGNFCGDDFMNNYLRILDDIRATKQHIRIDMRMYSANFDQEKNLKQLAYYTGGTYLDYKTGACTTAAPKERPPGPGTFGGGGGGISETPPLPLPTRVPSPQFIEVTSPTWQKAPDAPEPAANAPAPVRPRPPVIPSNGDAPLTDMGVYRPKAAPQGAPAAPGAGGAR